MCELISGSWVLCRNGLVLVFIFYCRHLILINMFSFFFLFFFNDLEKDRGACFRSLSASVSTESLVNLFMSAVKKQ